MILKIIGIMTAYLLMFFHPVLHADPGKEMLTITIENDAFVGEDDGYTNGTGITLARAGFREFSEDNLPGWLHVLTKNTYISQAPDKQRGVAHMFFQRMQTPEDISISSFQENELPYAGLLAWQGTMYASDERVSDQWSLYLGWIGPAAFAEQSQKVIHDLIGSDEPLGWDFQLENEPIIKIEMQRVWRLYSRSGRRFEMDVLGLWGVGLGTLESATKGGLAIRWGRNLAASFGAFSLQADRQVNPLALTQANDFYFFLGARGGYVANDILVDGNTFRDSHSVPLEHIQDQISGGVVWSLRKYAFVFQLSSLSSRTELSDDREKYGALSVTYRY